MEKEININIRNYRIKELKGLNIDPIVYYNISKFLEEKIYCVFKEHKIYIFIYESRNKAKRIDFEKATTLIEVQFNIDNDKSSDILDEWIREQKIKSYLLLDMEKNKDYLIDLDLINNK